MPLPGEWGAEGWEGPDRQLYLTSEAGSPYASLPRGEGTGQAAPRQRAEGQGGPLWALQMLQAIPSGSPAGTESSPADPRSPGPTSGRPTIK